MKWILSAITFLSLMSIGANLCAQQKPATPDSQSSRQNPATNPDNAMPQPQTDATSAHPSARAFEGTIQRAGSEFVLQENEGHVTYALDDQVKAKKFEGKDVRVMATVDPSTKRLHVIDITRSDTD